MSRGSMQRRGKYIVGKCLLLENQPSKHIDGLRGDIISTTAAVFYVFTDGKMSTRAAVVETNVSISLLTSTESRQRCCIVSLMADYFIPHATDKFHAFIWRTWVLWYSSHVMVELTILRKTIHNVITHAPSNYHSQRIAILKCSLWDLDYLANTVL